MKQPVPGLVTLRQVGERTTALSVVCSRCDQAGRFNLGILIARHGPNLGVPMLGWPRALRNAATPIRDTSIDYMTDPYLNVRSSRAVGSPA
jgi:hypothetical protein